MAKLEKFSRIIVKRTVLSGLTASIPITDDHTLLPAWSTSDIYIGEFFLNEPDEKLWIRVNSTTIKRILLEGDLIPVSGVSMALDDLTDVDIISPTDGDLLVYSAGTWSNFSITNLLSGSTQDVVVDYSGGTANRTLHFVNGLFIGYS